MEGTQVDPEVRELAALMRAWMTDRTALVSYSKIKEAVEVLVRGREMVDTIEVFGYPVTLWLDDLVSFIIWWQGVYEAQDTSLLRGILREGDVFVDVGAHIGYYSLLAARRGARVVAVEPCPQTFALLRENVKDIPSVTTLQCACWNEECEKLLYPGRPDNLGMASFMRARGRPVVVQAVTLDGLLDSLCLSREVDFLKIDVEGAELEVLQGAGGIIEASPHLVMLVEADDGLQRQLGRGIEDVLCYCEQLGMHVSQVCVGKNLELCPYGTGWERSSQNAVVFKEAGYYRMVERLRDSGVLIESTV